MTSVIPRSSNNCSIQRSSFAACTRAIYSASVDDSATVDCFLDFQQIAAPAKRNIYPETDFLSSPAPQSASENASKTSPLLPLNVRPMSSVCLKYLRHLFVAARVGRSVVLAVQV